MFMYRCTEFRKKKKERTTSFVLTHDGQRKEEGYAEKKQRKKARHTIKTCTYVCLSVRLCVCQCMHCSSISKAIRTRTC